MTGYVETVDQLVSIAGLYRHMPHDKSMCDMPEQPDIAHGRQLGFH